MKWHCFVNIVENVCVLHGIAVHIYLALHILADNNRTYGCKAHDASYSSRFLSVRFADNLLETIAYGI